MLKRQKINMLIVFLSTLISLILHITDIFGQWPVILFFIVFNLVFLIFYRDTRLKIAYHVIMILYISGYFIFFYRLIRDPDITMLFRAFMDFGSVALVIVAFVITFTDDSKKFVNQYLLIIALWAVIFYSTYTLQTLYYLRAIFGPDRASIENALMAFKVLGFVLWGLVAFTQAYLIYRSDELLQRRDYRKQKHLEKINNMYY